MNEQVDTQKVDRKIPRKQFYAYGVMYGSNNITNVARGLYIATYLFDIFKLQLELYLLANLIFMFYNVLNNVYVGASSLVLIPINFIYLKVIFINQKRSFLS